MGSRLIPENYPVRYIVFEGKQDLEKQVVRKIKKYLNPKAYFIILRDQDSEDCLRIKERLKSKCAEAQKPETVVRIACRELESWYLADFVALEKSFGKRGILKLQNKEKFRNPDSLGSPSKELKNLIPEFQKVNAARLLGTNLDLENDRSKSFFHFIKSIRKIVSEQ
jgi:hypothetical protein